MHERINHAPHRAAEKLWIPGEDAIKWLAGEGTG
jgi:hypothetical protein